MTQEKYTIGNLVEVIKKSGIARFHLIHSQKETTIIRLHIPMNADVKKLQEELYYKVPVGLRFDIRLSSKDYFQNQMIKRWGKTIKITTCLSYAAWDEECRLYEEEKNAQG